MSGIPEVDEDLVAKLERIGEIKDGLPINQRGWCNELGLFVQLRESMGIARIQAGGKFRSHIDLQQDSPDGAWRATKYRPGGWEIAVEPTLKLAQWVAYCGGMPGWAAESVRACINAFRSTGRLELPAGLWSTTDDGVFGDLSSNMTEGNWKDAILALLGYLEAQGTDAAAWDALRYCYLETGQFELAMGAVQRAVGLAPEDGGLNYEAATIYFSAITNAMRQHRGIPTVNLRMAGCTPDTLGRGFRETVDGARFHSGVAQGSLTASADHRVAAAGMIDFLDGEVSPGVVDAMEDVSS